MADDILPPPPPGFEPAANVVPPPPPGFEPMAKAPGAAGMPPAPAGFEPVPTAESRNWLQRNIGDPLGRGWNQLQTGVDVLGGEVGIYSPREVAEGIVQNAADQAFYPVQPDIAAAQKEINDAPTAWEAIKSAASHPRAVVQTAIESIPASGAAIVGGVGGAAAGGLAGPVGAGAGLMAGTGAVSGATEYASTIRDVLAERGIPDTVDAIEAALQNPELMAAAREKAALRAASVGAFDAATAGVAGRIAGPVARSVGKTGAPVAAQGLAGLAGETGAQMAGGAAGEAGAQLLSEGQISKPGAVVMEAAAEIPGAAHDVPGAMLGRHVGEKVANRNEAPAPPPGFVPVTEQVAPATEQVASEPVSPVSSTPEEVAPPAALPPPPPDFVPVAAVESGGATAATVPPVEPKPETEPQQVNSLPAAAPVVEPPVPPAAVAEPARQTVRTPDGSMAVDTGFEVVDLKDLKAADGALQPRQRDTRAASDDQINEIASRLDPERLHDSQESDRGAPIVDENGTILSGNGRVSAIELAASKNPEGIAAYREMIARRGFDTSGMENPVLVRRAAGLTADQKRDFVTKSNKDNKLAMSAGEQAAVDADLIDDGALSQIDPDTDVGLRSSSNAGFVRAVLGRLPAGERGAFMGADGTLSEAGAKRLEAAVFARAYGDRELTNRVVEEEGSKGTSKALLGAAASWAEMRRLAEHDYDITPDLIDAVNALADMRRRGVKLADFLAQRDAFAERSPETDQILRSFFNATGNRAAAWADVRDFLRSYASEAIAQNDATGDMFGTPKPSAGDILSALLSARDKKAQAAAEAKNAQGALVMPKAEARPQPQAKPEAPVRLAAEDRLFDDSGAPTRVPRGGLAPTFMEHSVTKGSAVYEDAFRDAGLDPDRARSLPASRQLQVLGRLVGDKFGLAAVNDRGIKALDGIDQLVDAYRNVQFMAHALGLPNTAIGLGGSLKLDLEAFKGRYLGAYSPDTRTIHMPGRSNSFAHEWGHALDHYLLEKLLPANEDDATKTARVDYLLSHAGRANGLDTTNTVQGAFAHLLATLFDDKASLAAKIAGLQVTASETDMHGLPTAKALKAQAEVDKLSAGARGRGVAPSDYARSVDEFAPDNDYWLRPTEMLARAFEAYVAHKVEAVGGENAFITKSEAAYLDNADRRLRMTFPKDSTRAAIFAAFDDVLAHVQAAHLLGTDAVASHPGASPKLDPLFWLKQTASASVSSLPQEVLQEARKLRNGLGNIRESAKNLMASTALNAGFDPNAQVDRRYPFYTRMADWGRHLVFSMRGILQSVAARAPEPARPAMQTLMDHLASVDGTGRAVSQTFEEAVTQQERQAANRLAAVLTANGLTDHMSAADRDALRGVLLGEAQPGARPEVVRAAGELRRLFNEQWRANADAGLEQGYVKDTGYVPRISNDYAVFRDPEGFKADATKVREIQFDRAINAGADMDEGHVAALNGFIAELRKHGETSAEIETQAKAAKRALREANSLEAAAEAKPDEADAMADRIAEARAAAQEQLAALADLVRPKWTDLSARLWRDNILQGNATSFDTRGPNSNYFDGRTLPPEADRLLEKFWVSDPVEAFQTYVRNSVRKREFFTRFGTQSGEKNLDVQLNANKGQNGLADAIAQNPRKYNPSTPAGRARIINELTDPRKTDRVEMLLNEAVHGGVLPEDVRTYRDILERITGRRSSKLSGPLAQAASAIHAYGTLALLSRPMWASLTEPLTAYFKTGSFASAFRNLVDTIGEVRYATPDIKQRRALAELWGITTSPYFEGVVQNVSHDYLDSPRLSKLTARMFERSGLTPLTNAQRRASMLAGLRYFAYLAERATDPEVSGAKRKIARAELRDYGFSDEIMPDVIDWLKQGKKGELPSLDDANTKAGRLVGAAVMRFVDSTIQEPKKVDKPILATDPIGRLMFAIQSFNYRFMRSVHIATIDRGSRDYAIYRDEGDAKLTAAVKAWGGGAAGRLGIGFALLTTANLASTALREALLNGDAWDEKKRKGELVKWLHDLAISRAGLLGAFDPISQAFTGLRYQRDLTGLVAGPYVGYLLGVAQGLAGPLVPSKADATGKTTTFLPDHPDKKPSNNAQWNASKAAYQAITPALAALGSSIPAAGPLTASLLSLGMQKATSNSASDAFANTLVGEKDSRKRLRERELKKAMGGL